MWSYTESMMLIRALTPCSSCLWRKFLMIHDPWFAAEMIYNWSFHMVLSEEPRSQVPEGWVVKDNMLTISYPGQHSTLFMVICGKDIFKCNKKYTRYYWRINILPSGLSLTAGNHINILLPEKNLCHQFACWSGAGAERRRPGGLWEWMFSTGDILHFTWQDTLWFHRQTWRFSNPKTKRLLTVGVSLPVKSALQDNGADATCNGLKPEWDGTFSARPIVVWINGPISEVSCELFKALQRLVVVMDNKIGNYWTGCCGFRVSHNVRAAL